MSVTADKPIENIKKKNKRYQVKGRQVTNSAASDIKYLLGDRPRRDDLLIEYLH